VPNDGGLPNYYSPDDLREILGTLRKASSSHRRVNDAINTDEIIRQLQFLAEEYTLYRELELRPKYKNYRTSLKHIAGADFEALPDSIRERVIPATIPATLRTFLKNDFEQVRQNALAILDSKPKRGSLRRGARYYFVDELADIYEKFTGRKAAKVGKESGEKSVDKESGEKSHRKLLGLFYDFVLAALEPIEDACTGIPDVIDKVIDARRKQPRPEPTPVIIRLIVGV